MVKYLADELLVMHQGQAVEYGNADAIYANPQHEYKETAGGDSGVGQGRIGSLQANLDAWLAGKRLGGNARAGCRAGWNAAQVIQLAFAPGKCWGWWRVTCGALAALRVRPTALETSSH